MNASVLGGQHPYCKRIEILAADQPTDRTKFCLYGLEVFSTSAGLHQHFRHRRVEFLMFPDNLALPVDE